jgi:hypothetical protein
VEGIRAVALEVDALPRGVGGDEDAHRVLGRIAVEGRLDRLAPGLARDLAVEDLDALLAAVREGERGLELLFQVALGVGVLSVKIRGAGRVLRDLVDEVEARAHAHEVALLWGT